MGILLNNFFGARVAGAFGISQTVSGEASSLTGALQGAFQPAITTVYGAGDEEEMREMAFRVCKMGTLLTLLFAIPMALEIDEVFRLWLKTPPPYASQMCLCTLLFIVIEKFSCGHLTAVNATGRIAKFQVVRGILRTLVIPLALIPAWLNWGPVAVSAALPVSVVFVDVGDIIIARNRVGMSIRRWLKDVVLSIGIVTILALAIGMIPRLFLSASFCRIILTAGVSLGTMSLCAWFVVLSKNEQALLRRQFLKRFRLSE